MRRALPTRRGAIYVLVLIVSIIVTLIGILALRMVQSQARVARLHAQRDKASALAESAVQWGIHYASLKADWRDDVTSGAVFQTMALGDGQITVTLTDEADGDLADDDTDSFTITGTGTIGDASQTYSVELEYPVGEAHPALDESLTVGGRLYVDPNTLYLESGGTAGSVRKRNNSLWISPPVSTESPVDYPDPKLIDTWAAMGTLIPRSVHGGNITNTAFSKTTAPFSITPDPKGIYVLDAEGNNININNTQFTGTLVVINLGTAELDLTGCRFNFGDHGGPTLIVDGDVDFDLGWGAGVSQGIIYVDGDARMDQEFMLVGTMVITGYLYINTSFVSINDHPDATAGPPEGFAEIQSLRVKGGTWKRLVN